LYGANKLNSIGFVIEVFVTSIIDIAIANNL